MTRYIVPVLFYTGLSVTAIGVGLVYPAAGVIAAGWIIVIAACIEAKYGTKR